LVTGPSGNVYGYKNDDYQGHGADYCNETPPVPKDAVPKLARGRTPPLDEGASAIHSADERCAEFTLADLLADWPVVVSVIVTVNVRPLKWASAEILSPG